MQSRRGFQHYGLFYRSEKVSVICHAERYATAQAVLIDSGYACKIPGQATCSDARAQSRFTIGLCPARRILSRAGAAIDFACQRYTIIQSPGSRKAIKQDIILCKRIHRSCIDADAEVAKEIEFAEVLSRNGHRKEICLIDADATFLISIGKLYAKAKRQCRQAAGLISQLEFCRQIKIADVVGGSWRSGEIERNGTGAILAIDTQKILKHAARFQFDIRSHADARIDDSNAGQVAVQAGKREILVLRKIKSNVHAHGTGFDDFHVFRNQRTLLREYRNRAESYQDCAEHQ